MPTINNTNKIFIESLHESINVSENMNTINSSVVWKNNTTQIQNKPEIIYDPYPSTSPVTVINGIPTQNNYSTIHVTDIIINGNSIHEMLESINKQILLISRNKSMEKKYPELKEAYDNYNKILTMLSAMEAVVGDNNLE